MTPIDDNSTPEGCYGISQFAKHHSVSRSLVYLEISAGRLQARKAGGRTLITRAEAARWTNALPVMAVAR